MKIQHIRDMIADANKHDDGHLESYIRRRMSSQAESDIQAGVSAMKEYIETAPDILEQIEREAKNQELTFAVFPLLEHAKQYYLNPIDLIPEAAFGLVGLLDDTYLAMSLVQVILDTSTEPWIEPEIHLEAYNAFAGSLLGEDFERRLDTEVQSVRQQMVIHVVNSLTEVNQSPESPREPSLDDENHSGKIDNRFLGRWNHSTYMSSGGFSFSTHRYRIFGPDGRFVEGSQAFADSVHFDASGNWSGWDTASTGRRPGDQGTWEVDGSQLGLIWDDGSYAEYQYEVSGESMLLIPSQGENQLWEKG